MNISESEIGSAYAAAISYYSRKGQKAKAKELLNRGFEVSPNNYQLMYFKQSVGK